MQVASCKLQGAGWALQGKVAIYVVTPFGIPTQGFQTPKNCYGLGKILRPLIFVGFSVYIVLQNN
jgi:hypothetical protein